MEQVNLNAILYDQEFQLIKKALNNSGRNVAKAATLLSINRTTLLMKCRKFNLICRKCKYVYCNCARLKANE